jgi:hypothetical protein
MIAAVTIAAIVPLAACGSSSTSSTTTTASSTGSSTSESAPSTTTTTTTAASTSTSTTAKAAVTSVPCPSTGSTTVCEFYSPTKNISCEIDPAEQLCLTVNPPQAAHLQPDGTYTTCTGETCLSNAGLKTGVLAYGTSTSNGTFTCASRPTGVTCTGSGKGFTISTSGIQAATA